MSPSLAVATLAEMAAPSYSGATNRQGDRI
jgi:hypothetical protein